MGFQSAPVAEWTTDQVVAWLQSLPLPQLEPAFRTNGGESETAGPRAAVRHLGGALFRCRPSYAAAAARRPAQSWGRTCNPSQWRT